MDLNNLRKNPDVLDAEGFLRDAAKAEGLTWHQFCERYNIIDAAKERQIRRHEVPLND